HRRDLAAPPHEPAPSASHLQLRHTSVDRSAIVPHSSLPAEQHGYHPLHQRYPARFCRVFSVARLSHLLNRLHPH
uniref:Uncharacterized protein n=1 Tax=Triticum urartu TaxID=4572 RepID=A0A8R7P6N4_TRIUA